MIYIKLKMWGAWCRCIRSESHESANRCHAKDFYLQNQNQKLKYISHSQCQIHSSLNMKRNKDKTSWHFHSDTILTLWSWDTFLSEFWSHWHFTWEIRIIHPVRRLDGQIAAHFEGFVLLFLSRTAPNSICNGATVDWPGDVHQSYWNILSQTHECSFTLLQSLSGRRHESQNRRSEREVWRKQSTVNTWKQWII